MRFRTVAGLMFAAQMLSGQGKIIFSNTPINPANPGAGLTSFKAGEPIYGLMILPAPVKRLCGTAVSMNATVEQLELKHYVDNNYRDSGGAVIKGALFAEATRLLLDVAPEPDKLTAYKDPNLEYKRFGKTTYGAMRWSQELGGLSAGAHTMKIEVEACSSMIAAGEFKISGASFAHYAQLVDALQGAKTKLAAMPAGKKNDPALEAAMVKAMKASTSQAWKDQILRVVILDADWFLERHPISGIILFRYIRAAVAVRGAAGCAFYELTTFKQDYAGGQFRPIYYDGHGDKHAIPCESVNR